MPPSLDSDLVKPDAPQLRGAIPSAEGEWLVGGGELGALIRAADWSRTPLGGRASWPEPLRTLVSAVVASPFPTALLWGPELVLVYNDAYRMIVAGQHPAALGRPVRELGPEAWHLDTPLLAAVLERGESVSLEHEAFTIDRRGAREDACFAVGCSPVRGDGGRIAGALVTLHETAAPLALRAHLVTGGERAGVLETLARGDCCDLGDRERVNQALRDSEERFRVLANVMPQIVCVLGPSGEAEYVNPEWTEFSGLDLAATRRAGWEGVLHPADLAAARECRRAALKSLAPRNVELRYRAADGSYRWFLSRLGPVVEHGRVVRLVGSAMDIEDRRRAEEALRRAEERYRTLFTNMTEGFALGEVLRDDRGVPDDFRLLEMNEAFERQTGLDREHARGRPMREVLPQLERSWIDHYGAVALGAPPRRFESYNEDLGRYFSVYCFSPAPGRFAALFADVTERRRADEALRLSEARLRRLWDSGMLGVFYFDLDGAITDANDEFLATIGYTRDELESGAIRWAELTPAEHRAADLRAVEELRATGVDTPYEKEFIRKDGSRVPVFLGAAMFDESRQQGLAYVLDITDRRAAEIALRESDQAARAQAARLEGILAAVGDGVIVYDREGRTLLSTPAADEILGIPASERRAPLRERADAQFEIYDEGGHRVLHDQTPSYRAAVLGETVRSAVLWVRSAGGRARWIRMNAVPLWLDGRHTGAVLSMTDITDRKHADEEVRTSEQRLRRMIDLNPIGVLRGDAEGRVLYANDAYLRIIGAPRDALEGGRIRRDAITPPEYLPRDAVAVEQAKQRGVSDVYEKEYLRPDGTRVPVLVACATMDGTGELTAFVVDISDRRRAEDAARASREHLREANDRLLEADRRKDEFLGMLSHELRNPLAPVRNSLYILDRIESGSPQARRAREVASRQVTHITRLVDDLLDVTRIARGKIELHRTRVDLSTLVRRTVDDHHQLLQGRGLELALEVPPGPVVVSGDETRLAQVLGNLLHNAMKFTPSGGRVTVALRAEGPSVELRVRDTGAGIDPETMETMFEPFTQAKQTLARSEGGLGLGLALVKGLVALHGGEVSARSGGPGAGSELVVRLPVAPPAQAGEVAGAPDAVSLHAHRRVLVIDDNHDAADSLAQLVTVVGHRAEVAYDAFEGLRKAADGRPDVVLCDLGLPGMDGYEFARRFRAASPRRHVRLVAVSGYAQPEDVARALEAGFDAHVAKPADPDRLADLLG